MKNQGIEITKKLSEEQKRLLFFAPIALVIMAIVIYALFFSDGEKKASVTSNTNNWELPTDSQAELPNSMLQFEEELDKHNSKNELDANKDFFSDLDQTASSNEQTIDSTYIKIQEQLKSLDSRNRKPKRTASVTQNKSKGSSRSSSREKSISAEEKQMSEYERLVAARDMQLQNSGDISRDTQVNNTNSGPSNGYSNNSIIVRASIFKTQRVVPGDRVKLLLTEPINYNGKSFGRNTIVYGFVTINKNRLFIDVKTLNDTPVQLSAYDIEDNLKGLYSTRAGELWKDFENKSISSNTNTAIQDAGIDNRAINSTLRSLSSFFRKKNLRESEKILLVNDHELILKNI